MYTETIKQIKQNKPVFLPVAKQKIKGKDTYICPLCNHGANGDGITTRDNVNYKCFGCGATGDVIQWYINANGGDFLDAVKALANIYNIALPAGDSQYTAKPKNKNKTKEDPTLNNGNVTDNNQPKTDKKQDYNKFFLFANNNIKTIKTDNKAIEYLQSRGITQIDYIIDKYNIGYMPAWRHDGAGDNVPMSNRLIIPLSPYSYEAIQTSKATTPQAKKYNKIKQAIQDNKQKNWIFNVDVINDDSVKDIWVVESVMDALSIIDVGGVAVALGSVNNKQQLIDILAGKSKQDKNIIVALDNDDAGQQTNSQIVTALKKLNYKCMAYNPYKDYNVKDSNDLLLRDRQALQRIVNTNIDKLIADDYRAKNNAINTLNAFLDNMANVKTPAIPTGFGRLDSVLDGGLYEGLYIIGAISSLGKTTLTMQIADQLAQGNNDVIVFSLEMAKSEIISKSLSRLTYQIANDNNIATNYAKTSRAITTMQGTDWQGKGGELVTEAIVYYGDNIGKNIFIYEGIGDIGVEQIKQIVKNHILLTGNKPVVIIDYLQILAPYDIRATDKQNTDKAILELKRLSRDNKIAVIGISSLNRQNYNANISMGAFKESGAIEYSSDILIGLQFKGVGSTQTDANGKPVLFDIDKAKRQSPREIELKILKNRNGQTGDSIYFDYYPMFNFFAESDANNEAFDVMATDSNIPTF